MTTHSYPQRCFATLALAVLCSATSFTQVEQRSRAPLGLARLEINSSDVDSKVDLFLEDVLVVTGVPGATKSRKGKQDVVVLAGEATYARPLRAKKGEYGFVSFGALASLGSVIEIAGAKIGISESSAVSGYASVMVKGGHSDWEDTHLSVPFDSYEGIRFATLPVLTVRLDPEAGVLDRTIRPPLEFLRLSCALNLISIHS